MPDVEQDDIQAALALAGKPEDKLDEALTYLANLTVAYNTLSAMNAEGGNEYGAAVYALVCSEVHAAFHLVLDHKEQLENEEGE